MRSAVSLSAPPFQTYSLIPSHVLTQHWIPKEIVTKLREANDPGRLGVTLHPKKSSLIIFTVRGNFYHNAKT